jgi:hypothetical protein
LERAQESALARLPTLEEYHRSGQELLEQLWELWDEIGSTRDLTEFFEELEAISEVALSNFLRITIAQAMVAYCRSIKAPAFSEADSDVSEQAKRLVRLIRSHIARLQKRTADFESQLRNAKDASVKDLWETARRECWSIYEEAEQFYEGLEYIGGRPSLLLYDEEVAKEWREALGYLGSYRWTQRLAVARHTAFRALDESHPISFRFNDYASALRMLDELLAKWAETTKTRQGKDWEHEWENEVFSNLTLPVAWVFKDATGRNGGSGNRFISFLRTVLIALPVDTYHDDKMDSDVVPQRVKRLLRKVPSYAPFGGI